jgi:hypothetical protein
MLRPPIRVLGTESLHIDPASAILVKAGSQSASGKTTFALAVPNLPALRAWVLGIQGLSVHKGTADVTNMIGVAPR